MHRGLKCNLLKGNKSLRRKKKKKAQYLESQFCLICQKKKKKIQQSKPPLVDIVIMYILYNMKESMYLTFSLFANQSCTFFI